MRIERRALQAVVVAACLVPLLAGGAGVLSGPSIVRGGGAIAADLDSHFRYLSGLLLGIGVVFLACVPTIERRGAVFRLLCFVVVIGGLGRLLSLITIGVPGREHWFALAMELGTVPLITLWQSRLQRRWQATPVI